MKVMSEEDPEIQPKENKKEKHVTLSQEEYESLKQEAQKAKEFYDKYLRAYADLENTRKRMAKEKQEFSRYAAANLILALLPIVDNLERALGSLRYTLDLLEKQEQTDAVVAGIELIRKQLHDFLDQQGVSSLAVGKGEKFDPYLHEALMEVETNECPEGTIVEEIQRGYRLHDRVIRPAVVKVAKKPEQPDKKEELNHGKE